MTTEWFKHLSFFNELFCSPSVILISFLQGRVLMKINSNGSRLRCSWLGPCSNRYSFSKLWRFASWNLGCFQGKIVLFVSENTFFFYIFLSLIIFGQHIYFANIKNFFWLPVTRFWSAVSLNNFAVENVKTSTADVKLIHFCVTTNTGCDVVMPWYCYLHM